MSERHPLKVSYCTTCKGRLHHLKQTLPQNLLAESNNVNVEFVILDYGSEDGMSDWMKQTYWSEIISGRIRYARYESKFFRMAHAKNMAHRLSTGDVLCNLDADNVLGANFSTWLARIFSFNRHTISTVPSQRVSAWDYVAESRAIRMMQGLFLQKPYHKYHPGLEGRIAISREDFVLLRGYDERLSEWGIDDLDFCKRAILFGLSRVKIPSELCGDVIAHENRERLEHLSPQDKKRSAHRMHPSPLVWLLRNGPAIFSRPARLINGDGQVGCGDVEMNFSGRLESLGPLDPGLLYRSSECDV